MNTELEKELISAIDTIKRLLDAGVSLTKINNRLCQRTGMKLWKPMMLHLPSQLLPKEVERNLRSAIEERKGNSKD